jgi:hypothetical protein
VAFQQRARKVLDARATGTEPGESWRILLLPQPEDICLMVRIDALGVHELGLYKLDQALETLTEWLPKGSHANGSGDLDAQRVLSDSERSALVTVTQYTSDGSAEVAGVSKDVVLARRDGRLHMYSRDPADPSKLVAEREDKNVDERLVEMLA